MSNIKSLTKKFFALIKLKDIKSNKKLVVESLDKDRIDKEAYIIQNNNNGVLIIYDIDNIDGENIGYHIYFDGTTFKVDETPQIIKNFNGKDKLVVYKENNKLRIDEYKPKSYCNHLNDDGIPDVKAVSFHTVMCNKCGQIFRAKLYRSMNSDGTFHVANDFTIHQVSPEKTPYRYAYYIPESRYDEFSRIYHMLEQRFVKVSINGKYPKVGLYACVVFNGDYMYFDTVGNYKFEGDIRDVKFIYNNDIYNGTPYICEVNLIV